MALMPKDELESMELTNKQFGNSILRAQKQMEAYHFSSRKHLFDYDSVVDKQRQKMYARRNRLIEILDQAEKQTDDAAMIHITESPVMQGIAELAPTVVQRFVTQHEQLNTSDEDLLTIITKEFGLQLAQLPSSSNDLMKVLTDHVRSRLSVDHVLPAIIVNKLITTTNLDIIDHYRIEHIDTMQHVRDKVGLMSYARLDPLIQYKKEAHELFQQLQANIDHDIIVRTATIDRANVTEQIAANQARQESRQPDGVL